MTSYEIMFSWADFNKVNPHQSHIIQLPFIPRIGETVDLGYVPEHGNIKKKVTDVTYVCNTYYTIVELE